MSGWQLITRNRIVPERATAAVNVLWNSSSKPEVLKRFISSRNEYYGEVEDVYALDLDAEAVAILTQVEYDIDDAFTVLTGLKSGNGDWTKEPFFTSLGMAVVMNHSEYLQ